MRLVPYQYNGHTIHGGTLIAVFPAEGGLYNLPEGSPGVASRGMGNYPAYTGKELGGRNVVLRVAPNPATSTTYAAMMDTMAGWFDTKEQTAGTLIAKDAENSDKQWRLVCTPVAAPDVTFPVYTVALYADDPRWQAVTASGGTIVLTASGQSGTVTSAGNVRTQPVITVAPGTAKASDNYNYKRPVLTYNSLSVGLPSYPVDITNAGWNTTGLVGGGTVQADGDDVRVVVNGAEVERWFGGGGMNSATTGVWIVLDYSPAVTLTSGGTIASSGTVSTITFYNTKANATAIKKLPAAGDVLIDSERFTYTGKDDTAKTLTGVTRAVKGTSMASHSVGATVRWIEHDVWLMYGNASAVAPEQTDTRKPIFNLTTSTNASWDYDEFAAGESNYYALPNSTRAGSWTPKVVSAYGANSQIFTGGFSGITPLMANPTTAMGMSVESYIRSGRWQAETAHLEWRWTNPAGGSVVVTTGSKERNSASWPSRAALQYSNDGVTWVSKWNEVTPASSGSVTAFANNGTATLGASYKYLRYDFYGSVAANSSALGQAYMSVSDVTVSIGTSRPTVTLGAEAVNYYLNLTIANGATGESITLKQLMTTAQTLTVDCANHTVTLSDGTNCLAALALSSPRVEWLDIAPGANVLTFTDVGTAGVTVTLAWSDRNL